MDAEIPREQAHLEASRDALGRMRDKTASMSALAGDRVSGEYLKFTLWKRMKALEDDPEIPLFFGRLDYGDHDPDSAGRPGERFYRVTREQCDCATWLGTVGDADLETDEVDPRVARLRRRGWGEAKIKRWLEVTADDARKRSEADRDRGHLSIEDWATFIERALEQGVPTIGVCLGAQLLARAAGAWVGPAASAEVGWFTVELNDDGAADPVLGVLPRRVDAFQWHYYTFELPEGAVELARSDAVRQAFRLGDRAWGIQFHAEVDERMLDHWFVDGASELPKPIDEIRAVTDRLLGGWNEHGRALSTAFLDRAHLVAREPEAARS